MNPRNDDERLLELAASIADGSGVDWDAARNVLDPAEAAILEQLRVVNDIARVHGEPGAWGSLTIIEPIGQGSAGTVYRAFDADLQREVALKIVRAPHTAGSGLSAAVQEARLLARVQHRNVVSVFGAEHKDGEIAVSMELVVGKTLDAWVREHSPFSAREAALIGSDVCRALAAVHGAGLLHGDVKAHNVMREDGGRIVLMDFSAGREFGEGHEPQADDLAGTPVYVAPEVFRGQPRSRQSDIYSLGVLLFYLTTARYPIDGQTRTEIDRQHQRRARPRRLRDLRPDLPEAFIQVVERATAEEPADRYESAGEFEAALSRAIDGGGWVDRTGVWMRLAGALVFIAILTGATYWGFGYANDGRGAALTDRARATGAPVSLPSVIESGTLAASSAEYRVDAGLYRAESNGPVRLKADAGLTPGDRLYLQVETSVPAYVYVVNEDDKGESYLLFPLPSQESLNPLPGGRSHRLPGALQGDEMYWEVTSLGGREHFVIFVSSEPIQAFARVFALLPAPSAGRTVTSASLTTEAVGVLRGVGGLTSASLGAKTALNSRFTTPLPDGPETARGLWVRQITLENSGR